MDTVDAAGLTIGDDQPPRIMGVLNVSQQSPYKPSVFDDASEAAEYVDTELIEDGADIVDVGLESANKRFDVLSVEQELDRLETAIEAIKSTSGDAVFSIETRYHEVAQEALDGGFDMVNDICGFADPEMPAVCREYDVAVCKMASPPDLERPGAIEDVEEIYDALHRNGLTDKTIIDPAFGGWSETKTIADDRETFHRLGEFRALDRPILVSINRKNFLRSIADRETENALPVSLAATSMAVERGADVIRTHDVAETRDAALVGETFARDRFRLPPAETGVGIEQLAVSSVRELDRYIQGEPTHENVTAGVSRAYRLTNLSPTAVSDLLNTAGDRDVVVTGDADSAVVAGSIRAIERLADSLDTRPVESALREAVAATQPE